ncbi:hypothetical protein, partial [Rosenbergiella collisarenosi]
QLLQLCYTSELVESAFSQLQASGLPISLRLREGRVLVAMVGAGVNQNPLHCHRFWQQIKDLPVEFVWQSDEKLSLVA